MCEVYCVVFHFKLFSCCSFAIEELDDDDDDLVLSDEGENFTVGNHLLGILLVMP